jgi:hypothetical protein
MSSRPSHESPERLRTPRPETARWRAAASAALAAATLAAGAHAQNLTALDAGGVATFMQIHRVDPAACNVVGSCAPTDVTGGNIGQRIPPPPTPGGGLAFAELSQATWFTPGPTVHRLQPGCNHSDQWDTAAVLPLGVLVHPLMLRPWTGLSIDEAQNKLFFSDYSYVAEVDIPPVGTGGMGVPMPVAGLAYVMGPGPLAYPLTGVDYDPVDDTLWVLDSQYNVVHMDRPSAGGAVIASFNVQALFAAMPANWAEGIALDPCRTPPGLPRGVLRITDFSNQLLTVSTDGTFLSSCFVAGFPQPIVGLDLFQIDMNTFATGALGGFIPAPYLKVCGTRIVAQVWGRDSPATGDFLSDALEFVIGP